MGFKQDRNTTGVRKYWPVIGFVMLIAIGIISWFLAPGAIDLARSIIPRFTGRELPPMTMRIVFAVLLIAILGTLSAALMALAVPRREVQVREGDLLKERQEMIKRKEMERERMRKINRELRK